MLSQTMQHTHVGKITIFLKITCYKYEFSYTMRLSNNQL